MKLQYKKIFSCFAILICSSWIGRKHYQVNFYCKNPRYVIIRTTKSAKIYMIFDFSFTVKTFLKYIIINDFWEIWQAHSIFYINILQTKQTSDCIFVKKKRSLNFTLEKNNGCEAIHILVWRIVRRYFIHKLCQYGMLHFLRATAYLREQGNV